jgi:hypothetical protein
MIHSTAQHTTAHHSTGCQQLKQHPPSSCNAEVLLYTVTPKPNHALLVLSCPAHAVPTMTEPIQTAHKSAREGLYCSSPL